MNKLKRIISLANTTDAVRYYWLLVIIPLSFALVGFSITFWVITEKQYDSIKTAAVVIGLGYTSVLIIYFLMLFRSGVDFQRSPTDEQFEILNTQMLATTRSFSFWVAGISLPVAVLQFLVVWPMVKQLKKTCDSDNLKMTFALKRLSTDPSVGQKALFISQRKYFVDESSYIDSRDIVRVEKLNVSDKFVVILTPLGQERLRASASRINNEDGQKNQLGLFANEELIERISLNDARAGILKFMRIENGRMWKMKDICR